MVQFKMKHASSFPVNLQIASNDIPFRLYNRDRHQIIYYPTSQLHREASLMQSDRNQ